VAWNRHGVALIFYVHSIASFMRQCAFTGSVIAGLLLAGCADNPAKEAKNNAEAMPDPSGKIAQIIPNPYLDDVGDAPAAAKVEYTRIQGLIKTKRVNDAIASLTKMHQDYPKLSGPAVNLGLLYWKQKNYAQAQSFFQQAQAINKHNPDAYTQYAIMLREQGKFAEAEAQYQKALSQWPHNFQAHRDLGVLYDLYLVQPEKALQHFLMCDQLSVEPNKEIKGWIIELNRRLNKKPAKAEDAKLEVTP
jgi:tetratricopeptide (TPR) repeat protein